MKKDVPQKGKRTIYSIAVALLTVFFVAYATQTLYPSPQWDQYCGHIQAPFEISSEQECASLNGTWTSWPSKTVDGAEGWCDLYKSCQEEFEGKRIPYERNVFVFNLVLGLAILITAFFLSVEALSLGFMTGGAILMVYATMRYWSELSDVLRTFFLGIALAVLVYFGYKKLR